MADKRLKLSTVAECDEGSQGRASPVSQEEEGRRRVGIKSRPLEERSTTHRHPSDRPVQESGEDEAKVKAHLDTFMKSPVFSGRPHAEGGAACPGETLRQKRATSPWRKLEFSDEEWSHIQNVAGPSQVMELESGAASDQFPEVMHLYTLGREATGKPGTMSIQTLWDSLGPCSKVTRRSGDAGQSPSAEEEPRVPHEGYATVDEDSSVISEGFRELHTGDLPLELSDTTLVGAEVGVEIVIKDEPMETEDTGTNPQQPGTSSKSKDCKRATQGQKQGRTTRVKPTNPSKYTVSPSKPLGAQTPKQKTPTKPSAAKSPSGCSSPSVKPTSKARPKPAPSSTTAKSSGKIKVSKPASKVIQVEAAPSISQVDTVSSSSSTRTKGTIPSGIGKVKASCQKMTTRAGSKLPGSSSQQVMDTEETMYLEDSEHGLSAASKIRPQTDLRRAQTEFDSLDCIGLDDLSGSSTSISSSAASTTALMGDTPPDSGRVNPVSKTHDDKVFLQPDHETDREPLRVDGKSTIPDQLQRWASLDEGVRVHAFSFVTPRPPALPQERGPTALTTEELLSMAKRFAYVLRGCHSVGRGTVVCSLLPPSPERLVLDMAIILSGGTVLCLDSEPRVHETEEEYCERVGYALKLAVCRLAFCAVRSTYHNHCMQNMPGKESGYEALDVVGLSFRDWRYPTKGFLRALWDMEGAGEFVDPDMKPDHPAAIFLDLDKEGQDILVFYQHQAVLQLGAQMTQVLQLDRRRDVLFNPCPPSQPWGFPAAFLYSGVHTVTFDLMPCEATLGRQDNEEQLENEAWPWPLLPDLGVNVALFLPPVLNIFHDFLVADGLSFQTRMLTKASLRSLQKPFMVFSRVAIGGTPIEIEAGLRMLRRCEADVIKVVLANVCFGIMTSETVNERQRKIPMGFRRDPVGRCLTHLQLAIEDPDQPGRYTLCTEEGDDVRVGNVLVRCRYNMPCPMRLHEGKLSSLDAFHWTRLDLVGYVDHNLKLHVIGSVRPVIPVYKDNLKQWRWVDVRATSKYLKENHKEVVDAQVVHITTHNFDLPTNYNSEFLAAVQTNQKNCDQILIDHKVAVEVALCDPHSEVTQFFRINQFPMEDREQVSRASLMSLVYAARTEGRQKIIVTAHHDEGGSPSKTSKLLRPFKSAFACLYSPVKL